MKPITEREATFKQEVFKNTDKFPPTMLNDFFEYWSEPNKSGRKMKFELEKTWDLSRRLHRWANNGFGTNKKPIQPVTPKTDTKPQTEIEKLDAALKEYKTPGADRGLIKLAKWYDFLYTNKLMKQFTQAEVQSIKDLYLPDLEMCRGACVAKTFDEYANYSLTFGDIMKSRNYASQIKAD